VSAAAAWVPDVARAAGAVPDVARAAGAEPDVAQAAGAEPDVARAAVRDVALRQAPEQVQGVAEAALAWGEAAEPQPGVALGLDAALAQGLTAVSAQALPDAERRRGLALEQRA